MATNFFRIILVIFLMCIAPEFLLSSTNKIDSLNKIFQNSEGLKKAEVTTMLGEEYQNIKEYKKSIFYFTDALSYYKENKNNNEMIKVLTCLGNSNLKMQAFDIAIKNYSNALWVSQKINDKEKIAVALQDIGVVYFKTGDYEKAMDDYFFKALLLYEKPINKKELGKSMNNIGLCLLNVGRLDSSLNYFHKSLVLNQETRDSVQQSSILNNIGLIYLKKRKIDTAIKYFKKALKISNLTTDKLGISTSLFHLSQSFYDKSDLESSLLFAIKASDISIENNLENSGEIYKLLSDIYYAKWDNKMALESYKKYVFYHDNKYNERKLTQSINMESLYSHKDREKRILKLNSIKNKQNEKIKLQFNWIVASTILVFTIGGFLIFIVFQNRKLSYANKELVYKSLKIMHVEKENKMHIKTQTIQSEELRTQQKKYIKSNITPDKKAIILNKVLELFENKKIYVKEDITLIKVAKEIESNSSYISQIINEEYEKNFSNFLNEYRIKESMQLLTDNNKRVLSIEGIAQTVGFKSKSSFNKAFKKYTGVTPSFFEKSYREITS